MDIDPKVERNTMNDAGALASLLHRLRDKPGFPALSESVVAINEITNSEDQNVAALSIIIRKDLGLTTNILRVANSVTYRTTSSGGVNTVSRAVSVLGFATLRDIALTVMLFDQIKNRAGAREIRETILRAHLAGTIAREAGKLFMPRMAEEAYTYALLHGLGQIVVLLYFSDEAKQIQALVHQETLSENAAAVKVLGLDFPGLGQGVAKQWLFPSPLVQSMRPLPAGVIERPQTSDDMLWVLSGFGNEVSNLLAAHAGQTSDKFSSVLRHRFANVMAISSPQLHSLVQTSVDDTKVFASTLGVRLDQGSFVTQAAAWATAAPDDASKNPKPANDKPTQNAQEPTSSAPRDDAHQMLSAGISKLSDSIVGDFVLNDILRAATEILLRAMGFQRVLICLKDEKSDHMVARMGCGKDADLVTRKFRFPVQDTPNVFQLAVSNGLDIVIKDISDPKIADKIPRWYRSAVSAQTFALMPLMIKGQAVALIYCDDEQPNTITIPERELSLMKTLRNQVLLAIKQSDQN